jgi:hypothetical protein
VNDTHIVKYAFVFLRFCATNHSPPRPPFCESLCPILWPTGAICQALPPARDCVLQPNRELTTVSRETI